MPRPTAKLYTAGRSWRLAALIGVMLLGLVANRFGSPLPALPALGVVLLAGAALARRVLSTEGHVTAVRLSGTIVAVVFLATAFPPGGGWGLSPTPFWVVGLFTILTVLLLMSSGLSVVVVRLMLALMVVAFVATGGLQLAGSSDSGYDVQDAHKQAASVLGDGRNPYSDVVVSDSSAAEWNVGDIVGYSYPPVTMMAYVVGEWLGDARIVNVIVIAASMLLMWTRRRLWEPISVGVTGVLVLIPITGLVIVTGWTEPLQAFLLVAAAVSFPRPVVFGLLFGLAIASKQYMVLAAVPMLVSGMDHLWKRMGIAATVAAATILPFFLWNPSAMWNALVAFQLDRPIRGDSTSIWSLGMEVPIVVALLAAVAVGVALGWQRKSPAQLLLAQAATIGTYFVLSPNSFGNYWYFVAAVALAAVAMHPGPDAEDPGSSEVSHRNKHPQAMDGMQL